MLWTQNPDYQLECAARPHLDNVYDFSFPDAEIARPRRVNAEEPNEIDRALGIDVRIRFENGMCLYGQEKTLRPFSPETVTVEHMNNPKEEGDWFRMAIHFYLVAYWDEDETHLTHWIMLNWIQVILATQRGEIGWNLRHNSPPRRASLMSVPLRDMAPYSLLSHWMIDGEIWPVPRNRS